MASASGQALNPLQALAQLAEHVREEPGPLMNLDEDVAGDGGTAGGSQDLLAGQAQDGLQAPSEMPCLQGADGADRAQACCSGSHCHLKCCGTCSLVLNALNPASPYSLF